MTLETIAAANGAVLIAGAGVAGQYLALKLAPRPCVLLSAPALGAESSSAWAQGGVAAALAADDSAELHAADTIAAGAGLVDPVVARLIAEAGPSHVRALATLGAPFDRDAQGHFRLSLEAAHSRARVARVKGDLAGAAIMDALSRAVSAAPHVTILEGLEVIGLLESETGAVAGAIVRRADGALAQIPAAETVLALGGAGGLWRVTTNPARSRGHALAMAARVGALIADPEFMQFHPTAIDVGQDPAPLASEALRGEGAKLIDAHGHAFVDELAPRDVVARAIHAQRRNGQGAFLDCRQAVGAAFPEHFPRVFAACMDAGIDPRRQPIPVAPAAHYHMGGVVADLWARATVPGLSVVGECASTGAHGANRLASNSLLEALVFADRAAERLRDAAFSPSGVLKPVAPAPDLPAKVLANLRQLMQDHCGVERDAADRAAARNGVTALIAEHGAGLDLIAAAFIVEAAARRLESRGAHHCPDHPGASPLAKRAFLTVADIPALEGQS